jgi:hypothetical protein
MLGCKIFVGLPMSHVELSDYAVEPRGRDLLGPQGAPRQRYERQVMAPFVRMAPVWRECGVSIYHGATLSSLTAALRDGQTTTAIIVSHWVDAPEPQIELFDGMQSTSEVADAFPRAYVAQRI